MRRPLALLSVCLLPALALAGELSINVGQRGSFYVVEVDAQIDAQAERLRALITDYENLDRLSDSILESEIRETYSPVRHSVFTFSRVCVAIFCRDLEQVQLVEQRADGDIVMTIPPDQGDFSRGSARWHFEAARSGTRMRFHSELEPAFWVPPVIGPLLIRHALRRETRESIEKLQALAVTP